MERKRKIDDEPGGISGLFKSNSFSDISIKCGNCEWKLHKAILSAKSSYFKKAFDGGFKEANEAVMILHDDHEEAIEFMLMFLYGALVPQWWSDYPAYIKGLETNSGTMVHFVRIYACAEKHLLSNLKTKAAQAFKLTADSEWHADDFTLAVAEAYEITQDRKSSTLRGYIEDILITNAYELCNTFNTSAFVNLMQERSDLAIVVASILSNKVDELEDDVAELKLDIEELKEELKQYT